MLIFTNWMSKLRRPPRWSKLIKYRNNTKMKINNQEHSPNICFLCKDCAIIHYVSQLKHFINIYPNWMQVTISLMTTLSSQCVTLPIVCYSLLLSKNINFTPYRIHNLFKRNCIDQHWPEETRPMTRQSWESGLGMDNINYHPVMTPWSTVTLLAPTL